VTDLDTHQEAPTREDGSPGSRLSPPGHPGGSPRVAGERSEGVRPTSPEEAPPGDLPPDPWVEGRHGLEFPSGYVHLPTLRFPALSLDLHPSRLPDCPEDLDLPLHRFNTGIDALVIYAQPTPEDLPRVTFRKQFIRYVPGHFDHHALDLSGSFEEYAKGLSSKDRHELFRKTRKFMAYGEGTVHCRQYVRPEEMQEFHDLAVSVACLTYQAKWLEAAIPEGPDYRRELEEAAAKGRVRGFILFHGDRAVAYGNCRARGEVLDYLQTGYDPEYRQWSPGMVLLHEMLEQLFAEGAFGLLDLGSGAARWKRSYSTRNTRCANVYYFRWSGRNLFRVGLHCGTDLLEMAFVGFLDRLGLKRRLKRLLHFRLRIPGRSQEPRDP